jgi:hypothetical protein
VVVVVVEVEWLLAGGGTLPPSLKRAKCSRGGAVFVFVCVCVCVCVPVCVCVRVCVRVDTSVHLYTHTHTHTHTHTGTHTHTHTHTHQGACAADSSRQRPRVVVCHNGRAGRRPRGRALLPRQPILATVSGVDSKEVETDWDAGATARGRLIAPRRSKWSLSCFTAEPDLDSSANITQL